MCFSAIGSFVGGTIISSIGMATIHMNRERSKSLFAAIPIVFGIQQIAEGFAWFALQRPGYDALLKVSVYIFLAIAFVIWPTMIPLSVLSMEKSGKRRVQYMLLGIGIAISLCHLITMLSFKITAQISSFHIQYFIEETILPNNVALSFYLIATLLPLFASSIRRVNMLGIIMVLSYILAYILFREFLVSVWCFFAAQVSIFIWWILVDRNSVIDAHKA